MKQPHPQELQKEIDEFNREYKVGDAIQVFSDTGHIVRDVIKHEATIMGGHSPVAWLKKLGSYRLDRVIGHAHALMLEGFSNGEHAGKPYNGTIKGGVTHLDGHKVDQLSIKATLTSEKEFDELMQLLQVHKKCFWTPSQITK